MMPRRVGALSRQLAPARTQAEPTTSTPSGLKVTKVHDVLGAMVEGIDLKQPLTPDLARELSRIWGNEGNGLLVFKGQHLTEAELKSFAENFGTVMAHPFQNNTNEHHNKDNLAVRTASDGKSLAEDVPFEVSTVRDRADAWHTDQTWMVNPPRATFLQCVERGPEMAVGGEGGGARGDTMICSMTGAFDQLSPGLQRMLEGMTCRHSVRDLMNVYQEPDDPLKQYPNGLVMTGIENEHPAVIVHPVSGRKSMYVNNWPCKRFTGMSMEETAPLKKYLNSVATREKNIYRHKWSEGDLVIIDNRITMHYVFPDWDPNTMHRVMQRTMIADQGRAPGVWGQPRPVGVTGKTGDEMSTVADAGGSPLTYGENTTLLPGTFGPKGSQPFSDRVWDGAIPKTIMLDPEK